MDVVHQHGRPLDRHGAGRRMDYASKTTEGLAEAALATLGADTGAARAFRPGAAVRAARLIAELLETGVRAAAGRPAHRAPRRGRRTPRIDWRRPSTRGGRDAAPHGLVVSTGHARRSAPS